MEDRMRVLNPATGQMDDDAGIKIDTSIFSQTPQKKADYYNSLLGQGHTDAAIRTAFGGVADDNSDWVALRKLAGNTGVTGVTGNTGVTGVTGVTGNTGGIAGALPAIKVDPNMFSQTPQKKADYYNSLLAQGYTDAAIRTAFGGVSETDPNWVALRQLAWGVKTPAPINRTYVSNFTPVQQPTLTVAEPPKIDWGPFEEAYKAMVERNGT